MFPHLLLVISAMTGKLPLDRTFAPSPKLIRNNVSSRTFLVGIGRSEDVRTLRFCCKIEPCQTNISFQMFLINRKFTSRNILFDLAFALYWNSSRTLFDSQPATTPPPQFISPAPYDSGCIVSVCYKVICKMQYEHVFCDENIF